MGSHTSKKSKSAKVRIPKYDLNHFGVITIVFNPIRYRSREELYHKFDEHMTRSGVTLLTVECIFETSEEFGLPKQEFRITRPNDPRHLQIKAPSVLWLKENLINLAIKRLPPYVEYVAWLDADIEFERLDWAHLAINQLQHYPIVQLFESSSFLGPAGKKQILRRDYSFAYALRHGLRIDPRRSSECFVHPGYAWAMRRSAFDEMGGLLDFSILGSGDIHFCYALINRIEETIPPGIHEDYRYLAKIWGQRVAQIANNGTSVGYVPIHIYHHYHGNRVNRGYFERWNILDYFQFSPSRDLEKNNKTGLLRLTDYHRSGQPHLAKRLNDFERTIISYFRTRNEDNIKKPIPAINFTSSNTKSKLSSHDTVRPMETLSGHYRIYEDNQYFQLRDAQSGYPLSERNSFGFNSVNEAYCPTFARGSKQQQYALQNYFGQLIYYDDGNGNNYAASPGEISF